jgi:hypothetical protein
MASSSTFAPNNHAANHMRQVSNLFTDLQARALFNNRDSQPPERSLEHTEHHKYSAEGENGDSTG